MDRASWQLLKSWEELDFQIRGRTGPCLDCIRQIEGGGCITRG